MANSVLLPPDNAPWLPKYYTKPLEMDGEINRVTRGEDVADFASIFLKVIEGFKAGEDLELTEWQKWLTNNVFEVNADGYLRYRQVIIMLARKNGKTFLAALFVLYHLLTAPEYAEIYSAAKDRNQARLVWKTVEAWIMSSAALSKRFTILKSKHTITNKQTRSFYKPLSADAGIAHGLNPYVVIADELHAWEAANSSARARAFWSALTSGSGARPESQVIAITTAGDNIHDSLLGDLYKQGIATSEGTLKNDSFGFFCWEADENDDPLIEETWFKANPNLAEGLMSLPYMRTQLDNYAATDISQFLRFHLNIWSRLAGENFISGFHWNNAYAGEDAELIPGCTVTAGFDGSQTADSTVIVIKERGGKIVKVWEAWEKPVDEPNWVLNREDVEASLVRLHETYNVELLWADKTYFTPDVLRWGLKYGWNVTAIPQSTARMIPMGLEMLQDVIEGGIKHLDEELLTRHVMNAVMGNDGRYQKDEKNSKHKIDALVAMTLANGADRFLDEVDEEPTEWLVLR